MINSRDDYFAYLEADRLALGVDGSWYSRLTDEIWLFQRLLRRMEYVYNCRRSRLLKVATALRFRRTGTRLGFSIPINVFGPGLAIAHRGTIVVNANARVGANCRLHVCVNIGAAAGGDGQAPRIGDNCYIGPGAKIFGPIVIGDNTAIGANAVVNKSCPAGNCTLAGVPARVISSRGSLGLVPGLSSPAASDCQIVQEECAQPRQ
jgi:serine O-acetyltransferase